MYTSEFCQVAYLEGLNAVLCKWKKFCQRNDYREPLEYGLELINEKKPTVWITDTNDGFESTEEDTKWLLENFIPKTIASSVKKVIFIIKDDSP